MNPFFISGMANTLIFLSPEAVSFVLRLVFFCCMKFKNHFCAIQNEAISAKTFQQELNK